MKYEINDYVLPGGILSILAFSSCILHPSSFLLAIGTQQEVLKSINDSVGGEVDGGKLLAGFLVIFGIIIIIAIVNHARKRTVMPKVLNHPGKLLKEVSRSVNLKPAEIKQLKILAENQEVSSPLVLLLCPSVLSRSTKVKNDKIDKKVVAALLKKVSGAGSQARLPEKKAA